MTSTNSTKKYPVVTSEVAELLGMNEKKSEVLDSKPETHAEQPVKTLSEKPGVLSDTHTQEANLFSGSEEVTAETTVKKLTLPDFGKIAKAILPYVAVFAVGIFLYYFFFRSVNFSGLIKNNTNSSAPVTPKETALQTLQKQELSAYNKWILNYYFDVSDSKLLDPENDNSGNGLTNFQKYLFKLNPKSYDTLGIGMADSQTIAQGIDPNSGVLLSDSQKEIVSKYIDMEVVMNRLALYNLQNPGKVAGVGVDVNGNTLNPISIFSRTNSATAPNTGANINPIANVATDFNTEIAGRLEIPSLNINVPIIWSKSPKNFDKDLQTGVVHYPGTAMPGEIGTTYISGHSSNYVWAKGNYNQVFSKLGDLADNTSFKITVVQKNGKDAIYNYVVTGRKEFTPTDQEQFKNEGQSIVALSTCWPIGSTAKRLVVFGRLTQQGN